MSRLDLAPLSRAAIPAVVMVAIQATTVASVLAGDTKPSSPDICAQQGAGFVQVPGTNTCVRVGGSIRFDAGRGTSLTNAPNQGASANTSSSLPAASDPWKQAR